jgi:hypothetical protein
MLVLGIGTSTLAITSKFEEYSEYEILKFVPASLEDFVLKDVKNLIKVSCLNCKEPEDYEKNFDKKQFSSLKKYNKEEQEILVIVSGTEYFSSIILKMLEMVQKAQITILFLKTDLSKARKKNRIHQKVLMNILQEYARSGIFKEIILVDYAQIQKILGNVTIMDFLTKSTEMVVSSFHMINVLKNQVPVFGEEPNGEDFERISSLGIVDLETNEEEILFQIEPISSKSYLFFLNEKKIREDTTLLNKIDSQINQNTESAIISYSIYSSNFENDYVYVITRTGNLQED